MLHVCTDNVWMLNMSVIALERLIWADHQHETNTTSLLMRKSAALHVVS